MHALFAAAALAAMLALALTPAVIAGTSIVGQATGGPANNGCGPDPAPAPAAAWGLTCEVFVDNFTSLADIDLSNTKAPNYKWYVNNAWPNNTSTVWNSAATSPASNFTLAAGGGVTITPTTDTFPVGNMESCVASGTTSGYLGTVFVAPFYVDESVSWAGTGTGSNSWPDVWFAPTEFLTGGNGVTFDEIDRAEHQPAGDDSVTHEWNVSGNTINRKNDAGSTDTLPSPATYGTLTIPPALNSGIGLEQFYTNDVHQTAFDVTYSSSDPATFDGSSSNINCITGACNPNGTFIPMASGHYCLMLSAGPGGGAMTVTKVAVWVLPP